MNDLFFTGLGGALNYELGNNCAFHRDGDKLLLIDAGEGTIDKLTKLNALEDVKEIFVAITHTHADHIGGLGSFLWYASKKMQVQPKILYSEEHYKENILNIMNLLGVTKGNYEFIEDKEADINGLKLSLVKTKHDKKLDCYGLMMEDKEGKYYYSGDTYDIGYIRGLNADENVKKIYCDVANFKGLHIFYDDILDLDKNKIRPMHFNSIELAKQAVSDGFKLPDNNVIQPNKIEERDFNY